MARVAGLESNIGSCGARDRPIHPFAVPDHGYRSLHCMCRTSIRPGRGWGPSSPGRPRQLGEVFAAGGLWWKLENQFGTESSEWTLSGLAAQGFQKGGEWRGVAWRGGAGRAGVCLCVAVGGGAEGVHGDCGQWNAERAGDVEAQRVFEAGPPAAVTEVTGLSAKQW